MTIRPDHIKPGQESMWAYPRPAITESSLRHIRIEHRGIVLADTRARVRTLETSHPPSYYFPPDDILKSALRLSNQRSFCEWKGDAAYYDVAIDGELLKNVAWNYPSPTRAFEILRGRLAFYAASFDACFVDAEQVEPQPGGFYGG